MRGKDDFTLDIISGIDDDIIEKSLKKRYELWQRIGKRSQPLFFKVLIYAACFCIVATSVFLVFNNILPISGKQVPVYQGMTVSNDLPAENPSSSGDPELLCAKGAKNSLSVMSPSMFTALKKGNGNNKNDGSTLLPETDTPYYAMKNEDIYIFVHLSNPDDFEILSFTLNGVKYASNMFEDGSDLETLILKYNVGDVEGVQQYTIDAIKYIDGEVIKDVRMEGDKTVEVIVNADSNVIDFNASFDGWVLNISPEWSDEFSGTKEILSLAVYENETLIKELSPSDTKVEDLPAGRRLMLVATYSEGGEEKTVKYLFDTPKQSEGLVVVDGTVTGIGTCPDTVIYIDMPIADNAFKDSQFIKTVYMSRNVTAIGKSAFEGCIALESANIPDTVQSIGIKAFCSTGIKSASIPSGITEIPNLMFSDCIGLENIDIPESVKIIRYGAFENCKSLVKVELPEGLTEIEGSVFSGCSELSEITLPDGLEEIGGFVFSECTSLTQMTIPDSTTRIGGGIFKGCTKIESVTVPFLGPQENMLIPVIFLFHTSNSAQYNVLYVSDSLKSVAITNASSIVAQAFMGCNNIKSVFISKSVTSIGKWAFSAGLTDIYYGGSESDWEKIDIDEGNSKLDSVRIHFNASASDISK